MSTSLVGNRLREERERLALRQEDAALLGDVSREQWGRYERGAIPSSAVFVRLQGRGFDINYILGGSRTFSDALTPEEQDLLGCYRGTDSEGRAVVLRAAQMELLRVRHTAPGAYPPGAVQAPLRLQEQPASKPRRPRKD